MVSKNLSCYRSVGVRNPVISETAVISNRLGDGNEKSKKFSVINCCKCNGECIKNGHDARGKQRYYCKGCRKTRVAHYTYKACLPDMVNAVALLLCEGCGIRGIARILSISPVTVLKKIIEKAKSITKPMLFKNRNYQMDEMRTFIGSKSKLYWVAYAVERSETSPLPPFANPQTKHTRGRVVDFKVGARTNKTLRTIIDTLLLSDAKQISTDDLGNYKSLIPVKLHCVRKNGINLIERMNLNLRTHLKRLNRRTICYSKSLRMLNACLKIYWWCEQPVFDGTAVSGNQ